jgi:hypothetical protein
MAARRKPNKPHKQSLNRVSDFQRISPDDVLHLMQERDRQKLLDTRTEAQRLLGDPPPGRSALAQRTRAAGS